MKRMSFALGAALVGSTVWAGVSPKAVAQATPAEFRAFYNSATRCLSPDLKAKVDGKTVDVRACRVSAMPYNRVWPGHQRPIDQTELASYLLVETEGKTAFEIERTKPFEKAVIRPRSRGVALEKDGNAVRFEIVRPGAYTVEFDGEHGCLHLFVEPKRDFAEKGEPTLTFGPGVHFVGQVELADHARVYLHRDAVVYGTFSAIGRRDVKVYGYGVVDGGMAERIFEHCYKPFQRNCFHAFDSKDIELDGPVLLDSSNWVCALFNCEDAVIHDLKIVGQWRYNTDGIDLVNCRRVRVADSFVRSFDDTLVVKGIGEYADKPVEDILFERCVAWCGWGRTLEIGLETHAPHYRNVVYRDCDVIHASGPALDLQIGGEAVMDGVCFENIRVERGPIRHEVLDNGDGKSYAERAKGSEWSNPCVLFADNYHNTWVGGHPDPKAFGSVKKVVFRNVAVTLEEGAQKPPVHFKSHDKPFGEILVENFTIDGVRQGADDLVHAGSNPAGTAALLVK